MEETTDGKRTLRGQWSALQGPMEGTPDLVEVRDIGEQGSSMRTKPKHLKVVLIGVLLLMQLGSVLLILHGVSTRTRERLDENAHSSLAQLSEVVADRTGDFLMRAGQAPGLFSSLVSKGLVDPDDDVALTDTFISLLEQNTNVENIYIGREDGSFLLATHADDEAVFEIRHVSIDKNGDRAVEFRHVTGDGELVASHQPDGYDIDPRQRPWYRLAIRHQGVAWTEPYTFYYTKVPGITATTVLLGPDGQMKGALGVDVRISELSRFVADITPAQSASAAIVDGKKHIVAYSEHSALSTSGPLELPDTERFAHTHLKTLLDLHEQGELAAQEIVHISEDDIKRLAQIRPFRPLGNQSDTDWILVAQVPTISYEGGLVESIDSQVTTLITLLSILTLLCVAGVLELVSPVVRMAENASIDPLTGIANRRGCLEYLDARIAERRRHIRSHGLIAVALDLDGFKPINDRYGHATGDEILRQFVSRLQQQLCSNELLARTGGDEFIISLTIERDSDLLDIVDTIRSAVVKMPFHINGDTHYLGVTVGVARHSTSESSTSLLNRADAALINGKRIGKNRSYLATPSRLCAESPPVFTDQAADLPADLRID